MPARTRKTAAANGKADPLAADLDALRVEVSAEPEGADDGPVDIPLGDKKVRVKHFLDWPVSADELLIHGRFTLWAQKVLDGDHFATIWEPMDPTNRQVAAFIQAWEAKTGVPLVSRATSPTN